MLIFQQTKTGREGDRNDPLCSVLVYVQFNLHPVPVLVWRPVFRSVPSWLTVPSLSRHR